MCKRSLTHVMILVAALSLLSCQNAKEKKEEASALENHSQATDSLSEVSIFQLDKPWQNQFGEPFQLDMLKGKPTVMAMIYTHCKFSCPRIVADMKQMESLIPQDKLDSIHFLLVSIDPENDKPDTLRQFMNKNEMSPERWTLLSGNEGEIRELAAVVGFRYKKSSLMDYAHSNLVTLLNPSGEIIYQEEGFGGNKQAFLDHAMNTR